ncbi:MAG: hypothetical protein ACO3CR_04920 [Solirubrobacterales bacterium]
MGSRTAPGAKAGRTGPAAGRCSGQASLEWTGLAVVLAAGLGALFVVVAPSAPGFAHSVYRSLLCAASLSGGCPERPSLAATYGEEVSRRLESLAPELRLEDGVLGMPVDFRTCRSPACAEGSGITRSGSLADEPATLFTRVIDCRTIRANSEGAACGGEASGNLYLQYWAYFPESSTFRGAPVLERRGYHRHDWETTQVRIEPDGTVSQRTSSHAGYVYGRSVLNWPTDAGLRGVERGLESLGIRERGGWGRRTGRWYVAGGSHAGAASADPSSHPVTVGRDRIRLVPLETTMTGALARAARFDPITPPWRKRVWTDPESDGTG